MPRPRRTFPATPQSCLAGVIDWPQAEWHARPGAWHVPVRCRCGAERYRQAVQVLDMLAQGCFTGACRQCEPAVHREATLASYRQRPDQRLASRSVIHWSTTERHPRHAGRFTTEITCGICGERRRRSIEGIESGEVTGICNRCKT